MNTHIPQPHSLATGHLPGYGAVVSPPRPARKPRPELRRRLVPVEAGDGFVGAKLKSLTEKDGPTYHPTLCTETGAVRCDCDDFHYRKARYEPTICEPINHCKHIIRLLANERRLGHLPPLVLPNPTDQQTRPCSLCGVVGSRFERAEREAKGQFICEECVEAAKTHFATLFAAPRAKAVEEGKALARHFESRRPAGLCPACGDPEVLCLGVWGCRSLRLADQIEFEPDMSAVCWTAANHFGVSSDQQIEVQHEQFLAELESREQERDLALQAEVNLSALRAGFSMAEVFGPNPSTWPARSDFFGDT